MDSVGDDIGAGEAPAQTGQPYIGPGDYSGIAEGDAFGLDVGVAQLVAEGLGQSVGLRLAGDRSVDDDVAAGAAESAGCRLGPPAPPPHLGGARGSGRGG